VTGERSESCFILENFWILLMRLSRRRFLTAAYTHKHPHAGPPSPFEMPSHIVHIGGTPDPRLIGSYRESCCMICQMAEG
jgi:hypothetical protein